MKKHFLLLVMALMSLTGWAQTATFGEVAVGKYTYGDALPTPQVKDSEGAILPTTSYTVDANAYAEATCETVVAKADMKADETTRYYLKISGAGAYVGEETSGWFVVSKAPLTIAYEANALDRGYGDAPVAIDPTKFGAPAGFVLGQDASVLSGSHPTTYSTADNNVGADKEVTFGSGKTAANYTVTYTATLTISKKDLSGSANITVAKTTMVYTGKKATGMYTVKNGETTLTEGTDYTIGKAGENVTDVNGAVNPTIVFSGNYTGEKVAGSTFAITKAPITVSIDDIEVTYNGNDQKNQSASAALKFNYSGIVGDDVANAATMKAAFTRPTTVAVATEATNVGTYELAISNDGGTGAYTNYEFKTWVPGTLTIKKAELKLKAKNASKTLGAADPEFELATPIAGLAAAHSITGVTFTREKAGTTEGEAAGEYAITPNISAAKVIVTGSDPEVSVKDNYDLKVDDTKGVLSIGKGAIMVIIKDAEKEYGADDPTFTYKAVGLAEGDALTVTISRDKAGTTAGEAIGAYALTATATGYDETKYSGATVVDGVFTIKQAKLTFVIPVQNIAKNSTVDDLVALKKNITVTGVHNSDVPASLYDLSFGAGVTVSGGKANTDESVDGGLVATLTAEADDNYVVDAASVVYIDATSASGKLIVGAGDATGLALNSVDADYAAIVADAGETEAITLKIDKRTREVPAGTAHSWAAQTWNAMVLPAEVSVADLSAKLGYAIVNRVDATKTTEGNVVFKLEMDKIPANEPFCIKTTEAIADGTSITLAATKIVAPGSEYPSVDAGCGYKFVGVYKGFTIDKTKSLFYFLRGDNAKWAHIGSSSANTWDMVSLDAYIDQTGASSARELTFTFQELDGSYTAIKSVAADKNDEGAAKTGWYNLNGMKLQSAPAQKGVYIHNGKKVIIK